MKHGDPFHENEKSVKFRFKAVIGSARRDTYLVKRYKFRKRA